MTLTKPQEKMAKMLLSEQGEPHCDWCDEDIGYEECFYHLFSLYHIKCWNKYCDSYYDDHSEYPDGLSKIPITKAGVGE